MAKKTTKPRKVTPEVAALLRRVRARNDEKSPLAAMSLADHLELNDLPLAKSVRTAVNEYLRDIDHWSRADFFGKKLGRNEVLKRVRNRLYWKIGNLFGKVTTSDGPKMEKLIRDKVAELRHIRARIKRLETSAVKRGKRIASLAAKHLPEALFDREDDDGCYYSCIANGSIGETYDYRLRFVVLNTRTAFLLPSGEDTNNKTDTAPEGAAEQDEMNDDQTS